MTWGRNWGTWGRDSFKSKTRSSLHPIGCPGPLSLAWHAGSRRRRRRRDNASSTSAARARARRVSIPCPTPSGHWQDKAGKRPVHIIAQTHCVTSCRHNRTNMDNRHARTFSQTSARLIPCPTPSGYWQDKAGKRPVHINTQTHCVTYCRHNRTNMENRHAHTAHKRRG